MLEQLEAGLAVTLRRRRWLRGRRPNGNADRAGWGVTPWANGVTILNPSVLCSSRLSRMRGFVSRSRSLQRRVRFLGFASERIAQWNGDDHETLLQRVIVEWHRDHLVLVLVHHESLTIDRLEDPGLNAGVRMSLGNDEADVHA